MIRAILVVTLLCIAIAAARLAFLHDYPEWDQSTYFLIGDAMLHGKQLYAQIWDMKPPAIFATYAIANLLTRSSFVWTGYVLSLVSAIGGMIAVYFAGAKLNRSAGLLAATIFALVCMHPSIGGTIANTESFINLFLAMALAIWLHRGERMRGAILAGICLGIATLYKHVAIAPAMALAIANVISPIAGVPRRGAIVRSIALLAPIPLAWLIVFAYFAATGRASIFYETNFVYARFYGGSILHNLNFAPLRHPAMRELVPLVVLALLGFVVIAFVRPRTTSVRQFAGARAALMAMFIASYVAIAMPGQGFEHYQQLWLIPMCLSGAWGAILLHQRVDRPTSKQLIVAVTGVILIGLILMQWHWYASTPRERAALQRPASLFLNGVEVATEIRDMLRPDETMFLWCDEAYVYVIADKRPPATALWKYHSLYGPVAQWLTDRTVADLDRHPPDLIVLWLMYPGPQDHPIYRWIAERYDPISGNGARFPLMLWARRDSDLHRRTSGPHDK